MSLESDLHLAGGITTSRTMQELGHSEHALRRALRDGRVIRPRRAWIALPGCDPELIAAAERSVVLTCITQARRLQLWVPEETGSHVAVRTRAERGVFPGGVVHWSRPIVARHPSVLGDPIENVLHYVALCQSHERALTIWDSALNRQLVDIERLAALPLRPAARRVLSECTPFADSGLETLFRTRLRWLRIPIRSQIWLYGHRVDFLLGDWLVVQVDGRQHSGAQRAEDNRHDTELRLRGYSVLRFTYAQVVHQWPMVQDQIQRAIAAGLHRSSR